MESADAPNVRGVPRQRTSRPLNRQQRRAAERAAARGRATELAGFQMFFTDDELPIVEEALAMWVHQTGQDLKGLKLTPVQDWALQRAEKIRQGVAAAIDERPWFDIAPQRKAPTGND